MVLNNTPSGQTYNAPAAGYAPSQQFGQEQVIGRQRRPHRPALGIQAVPHQPGLYAFRLRLDDFTDGLNKQRGYMDRDANSLSASTGDSRFEDTFIPCLFSTEQTTVDPDSDTVSYLSSLNIFNTLAIGAYNATNTWLLKETSATDPTLIQITYAKGAGKGILGLKSLIVTGTTHCAVLAFSIAIDLLQNLTTGGPTSTGSMHAQTVSAYWATNTGVASTNIIIKATTSIFSLSNTALFGDAPTATLTNLPTGGYGGWLKSLGGSPPRIYFNMPNATTGSAIVPGNGAVTYPSDYLGLMYSVDQAGSNLQKLDVPLNYVVHAAPVRDGFVMTDQKRVIFHNGRTIRDFGAFSNRTANSDRELVITGFEIADGDQTLRIVVNEIAAVGGTGNTKVWKEEYDWDTNTWHVVGYSISGVTLGTTGVQSYAGHGSLPVSKSTGYAVGRVRQGASGSWWRQWLPPAGMNPFGFRKTQGATAASGQKYEPSAVATSPVLMVPGHEGSFIKVTSIIGPPYKNIGDYDSTATTQAKVGIVLDAATAAVEFSCQDGVLADGTTSLYSVGMARPNHSPSQAIQPVITSTQKVAGVDPTLGAPNAAGFFIEGYVARDPALLKDL